jgi:magnesium-transporting ATPase (P-type)
MSTLSSPHSLLQGLSEDEVRIRRANGQGNTVKLPTSRSYGQMLRENLLILINLILFTLSITLVLLGRLLDAITTVAIISFNIVVSLIQEIRAKRALDRIALLSRPTATVLREGKEQTVDPSALVVGDLLVGRPGDQIVVDGRLVDKGWIDVDESLLTGESDLVRKRTGDPVSSGSFCVNGSAVYEAVQVGAQTTAYTLTAGARTFRRSLTPLQQQAKATIRILLGLRVLLLACYDQPVDLYDANGQPRLQSGLIPLGFVSLGDVLRPGARTTLTAFSQAGVQLKVISGDNPQTVTALAKQVGFAPDLKYVSGLGLAQMEPLQFAQVVRETTVFGRITPQQKERIVQELRAQGAYVAMVGDGVNDVLALKRANLGIAIQSGSQMTRTTADPAALTASLATLFVFLTAVVLAVSSGLPEAQVIATARSTITVFATVCGVLLLLVFVAPPAPFWAGGNALRGDWRPTVLAGVLLLGLGVLLSLPAGRAFFEIQELALPDVAVIVSVALLWALLVRFTWRLRLLERILGIHDDLR